MEKIFAEGKREGFQPQRTKFTKGEGRRAGGGREEGGRREATRKSRMLLRGFEWLGGGRNLH